MLLVIYENFENSSFRIEKNRLGSENIIFSLYYKKYTV